MSTASTPDPLERIEQRLARIEALLTPAAALGEQLPAVVAVATDTVDAWARERGDTDERLQRALRLLERVTRPAMLERLEQLLNHLDAAPGMIAMLGDMLDDFAARAAAEGAELDQLAGSLRGLVLGAARSAPAMEQLLGSGALDERAAALVVSGARAASAASAQGSEPVGMMGALKALREPEVQRALGFLVAVARNFGAGMNDRGGDR